MAITVGELKELLKKVPDDFKVEAEGCDCTGDAFGIEVDRRLETCEVSRTRVGYTEVDYKPKPRTYNDPPRREPGEADRAF